MVNLYVFPKMTKNNVQRWLRYTQTKTWCGPLSQKCFQVHSYNISCIPLFSGYSATLACCTLFVKYHNLCTETCPFRDFFSRWLTLPNVTLDMSMNIYEKGFWKIGITKIFLANVSGCYSNKHSTDKPAYMTLILMFYKSSSVQYQIWQALWYPPTIWGLFYLSGPWEIL